MTKGGILPLLLLLLPVLAFALLPAPARADGGFFKEQRDRIPVPIPAQRALLVHRDGVERLVVESTVDAKAQALGWILPLPAKPTSVEAATPGILDTLDMATRARVEPDGNLLGVFVLPALGLLLVGAFRLHRASVAAHPPPGTSVLRILLAVAVFLLLGIIAIPNLLATAGLGTTSVTVAGVEASAARRIGSYDVAVLEARDAAALGAWLEAAGLAPLSPEAVPVVEEHIREGWVFVAARLAHEGDGLAAPHPLSVAFPAERPVYPMRLTALSGGRTDLRLHVVAEGSASCRPLRVTRSRRFVEDPEAGVTGIYGETRPMLVDAEGRRFRGIAHPGLRSLLWDGCVVTRLEGSVAARDMDRDFLPEVGAYVPSERVLRTAKGAWRVALFPVSIAWLLGLLVLMAEPFPLPGTPRPTGRVWLGWFLALTAGAGVVAAGIVAAMEVIPAADLRSGRVRGYEVLDAIRDIDGYAGRPLPEARAALETVLRLRGLRDPLTGEPLRWGDSPGCVELFEDDRGPVVRAWSLEGAPVDVPWHEARIRQALGPGYRVGDGPLPTVEDLRARFAPGGVLLGGLRNPFTGEPLREGTGPGDVEFLVEGTTLLLRVHGRGGRTTDLDLRSSW